MAPVTVREAGSLADLAAMGGVFEAVWRDGQPAINFTKAIQHAGGYAAVAAEGDRVVAGSLGFIGRTETGEMILHSHITGALPGLSDRGIGFAIKQHQRSWCLERGIDTIRWTFDPLVRRNGYFNLTKLGAEASEYHADFYGPMDDAMNAGDETDRILATWRLTEERVPDDGDGGVLALDIAVDGSPVVIDGVDGPKLLFRVPSEIDPGQRVAWRRAVRSTLGATLDGDHVGVGMTRDGCYVVLPR